MDTLQGSYSNLVILLFSANLLEAEMSPAHSYLPTMAHSLIMIRC